MIDRTFIHRFGVAAILVTTVAGCGRQSDSEADLTGRWVSTISSEFLLVTLSANGDRLTGEAELMPQGARVPYSLDGSASEDEMIATLRSTDGQTISMRGDLRGDTLYVHLTGGAYQDRLVPLVRSSP